jgi:fumarate reductase flavoprotein subunit
VGLNGANRLGSNSLTECLVFGARAGQAAAQHALESAAPPGDPLQQLAADEARRVEAAIVERQNGTERFAAIREAMQAAMEQGVGVFRTAEGLRATCTALAAARERFGRVRLDDRSRVFNTELFGVLELDFLLDVAEAVAWSAQAREESRGSHARRDFPERDDDRFLAHSLAYRQDGGPPRIDYQAVRLTRWPPQARTY